MCEPHLLIRDGDAGCRGGGAWWSSRRWRWLPVGAGWFGRVGCPSRGRSCRLRRDHFFGEWDHVESDAVAILRTEAGRDPYDRQLTDLSENCPPAANGSAPSGPDTT